MTKPRPETPYPELPFLERGEFYILVHSHRCNARRVRRHSWSSRPGRSGQQAKKRTKFERPP